MSDVATFSPRLKVEVDYEELADLFCQLSADAQANFFNEVAKTFAGWPRNIDKLEFGGEHQADEIARALVGTVGLDWVKSLVVTL